MQTPLIFVSHLLAGSMLLGVAVAQQGSGTPASLPSSAQTPAAQGSSTKSTTAAKTASGTARKSAAAAPLTLKTDAEKQSYAMGMNLGTNLHRQGITLNPALVARGLKDAQAGGKTLAAPDQRVLEIQPAAIHQRTPVILGAADQVDHVVAHLR